MAKTTPAEEILAEARDRLQKCIDAENDNRLAALDDLRFITSDQWDQSIRAQRVADHRPCLTINKLPAFLHQVTNDQRQNRPSIKVHPVDDDADPETADVLQGLIRHIEYVSNADIAYDTAVNSAAAIGFGYFRLVTEYCYADSFDQDIRFKRIRNAFTVYMDPASTEPDGSDQRYCFITEEIDRKEFERQYPKSTVADGTAILSGPNDTEPNWVNEGACRIAEYYRIEDTPAMLVAMPDGKTAWGDELPKGASDGLKKRPSSRREVWWYKLTGADVLERAKVDCYWIPVFPVYGDEADVEGKVVRSGLIRNAKDPQRMYNLMMTAATEEVALRPKAPYIGAAGQFEGFENDWSQANNKSFPYLEYNPVSLDSTQAPPPQRQPMADIPNGMLTMAMHASDNIKATTGIFDASLGAKGNETSGKAILARQKEGDTANFHYSDNLVRTLRHAGRCIMWMIPYIYDVQRVVKVMGEDGQVDHEPINTPAVKQARDPNSGEMRAINTVLNDMTVGEYDVTVTAGPSYSTLRQETLSQLMELNQSWPKLMDIAGDKVIGAMDVHGGEEIAERIKRTIPPQILGPDDGDDPEEAVQRLTSENAQLKQEAQQMTQVLDAAHQEIQKLDSGEQTKVAIAQQQEQTKRYQIDQNSTLERLRIESGFQQTAYKEDQITQRDAVKHDTVTAHVAMKEQGQNERQVADHIAGANDQDVAVTVAQMNNETKEQIAALQAQVQLLLAAMQPPPQVTEEAAKVDS